MCSGLGKTSGWCYSTHRSLDGRGTTSSVPTSCRSNGSCSTITDWYVLNVQKYANAWLLTVIHLIYYADSQVFAEEVEPTGAVPMELSLERYRHAALQTSKTSAAAPTMPLPGGPISENDKRLQPRLLLNMFPGSVILKNDKLHLQGKLNGWYGMPKQLWRLVFRSSTHGYSAGAFHRHCDGVAPTFTIALVRYCCLVKMMSLFTISVFLGTAR